MTPATPFQRADDARIACPLFQAEYGGLTPTSALQLKIVKIHPKRGMELNGLWHSRLPEISNYGMCDAYAAEFGNVYYAVALWSVPCNQNLFKAGCWELRRMAIAPDAPRNTASRMLRIMASIIRKERANVNRIISYQDTSVHLGTIYKAAGWTCVGRTHKGGACGWSNNVRFRAESNGKKPLLSVKHRWELEIKKGADNRILDENGSVATSPEHPIAAPNQTMPTQLDLINLK